jgi:hypothetical protein
VAKTIQASIKYLITALELTNDDFNPDLTEGLFRGIALLGNAFGALQVERYSTPLIRDSITEAAADSQMPLVVQKARKEAFFRQAAGATAGSSLIPDTEDDDPGDPFLHPGKKKRDIYKGTRRLFRNKGFSKIRKPPEREYTGYFKPRQRYQPTMAEKQASMQKRFSYHKFFKHRVPT